MTSGVPILPALGTRDGSQRLPSFQVKQIQQHSPSTSLPQLAQPHPSNSPLPTSRTLPPISTLAELTRSPTGSPASLASSEDFTQQQEGRDSEPAHDAGLLTVHHHVLSRKRGSASSDEVVESMDTGEDGPSAGVNKPRGQPRMPMGVPAPTWTHRWTSRAPPPRPLDTNKTSRTVMSPTMGTLPSVMAPVSGRHHPYAGRTGGMTAPSPTWPAHIGLDDTTSQQSSHTTSQSSSPHVYADASGVTLNRPRANTVADKGEDRRPALKSRESFQNPPLLIQRTSMELLDQQRRRENWRGQPTVESYSGGFFYPVQPPSPLLFSPLSPWSGTEAMSAAHGASPMYQPAFSLPPADTRPSGNARYGGQASQVHSNMLQLSLHDQQQSQHLDLSRRTVGFPTALALPAQPKSWANAQLPQEQSTAPVLERFSQSRRRRRPPYSYSSLIAQAITSSSENRMTLREIYTWISDAYPDLYSMDGADSQGWQNTVRHNLSLNRAFVKVARTAQDIYDSCASSDPAQSQAARGKGGWWTIDPSASHSLLGTAGNGDGTSPLPSRSPNAFSGEEYFPSPSEEARKMDGPLPTVIIEPVPATAGRRWSSALNMDSRARTDTARPHTSSSLASAPGSSDPVHPKTKQLPSVLRPASQFAESRPSMPSPSVAVGLGFESTDSSSSVRRLYSKASHPHPYHQPPTPSLRTPPLSAPPAHHIPLPSAAAPLLKEVLRTTSAPTSKMHVEDVSKGSEPSSDRKMAISGLLC